jgi:hypothetical protein
VTEDTKTLLLFLFDASSLEVSVDEIARGTGLGSERIRAAAVPGLVELIEWSSAESRSRYALTPTGRRTARELAYRPQP